MAAQLTTLTAELVGRRYPEFKFFISETWAQDFKHAIGYSLKQIEDPSFVPPTFIACLRDGNFNAFAELGIELSQLLHAGQSYRFYESFRSGDLLSSTTEIVRVLAKKGKTGEMVFMDFLNVFSREERGGERHEPVKVAESLMSVVVRNSR
jgi:hypothetical protein